MPAEIFAANSDGTGRPPTHASKWRAALAARSSRARNRSGSKARKRRRSKALLLRPPHFDASKKYPLLLLIHGGPQGEWDDDWGYRWNPEVMAAPGYVVLMINPRGSFGYGHKFTEEISRDWGGKVYEDLMKGVDAAIAKYPFIDGRAGRGGRLVRRLHDRLDRDAHRPLQMPDQPRRALGSKSACTAHRRTWFVDWEFGGPPWSNPELYKKWSPSEYASALGKFKTPTLVIGGELDYPRALYAEPGIFYARCSARACRRS